VKGYRLPFTFPFLRGYDLMKLPREEGGGGARRRRRRRGDRGAATAAGIYFSRDRKLFSFASRAISASHSRRKCQLTSRSPQLRERKRISARRSRDVLACSLSFASFGELLVINFSQSEPLARSLARSPARA